MGKMSHVAAGVFAAFLVTTAIPAAAAPGDTRILYYDPSRAMESIDAIEEGAAAWNKSITIVRLERAPEGATPDIVFEPTSDGWPASGPQELGRGLIKLGRQAVAEGHYPPRIVAHEFGHILGLPDNRTGLCEDLMSGGSAQPSCRNALPSAEEVAQVEQAFAGAAD